MPLPATIAFLLLSAAVADDRAGVEFFEARIRPVLVERCYACHSGQAKSIKGGLRLDRSAAIRQGGDSGVVVVPEKPAESLLIEAISYLGNASPMPPSGRLPDKIVADFRRWVELGAPLPEDIRADDKPTAKPIDLAKGRNFWSFQPLRPADLPALNPSAWTRNRIDRFIERRLTEQSMRPAAEADKRTLVRRLYFDLIGLPPTFAEVTAFAADESPDAYLRLVDKLLASPQYGERWARHWLDLARYAEDNPTSESTCKPPRFPHRYRDWVVNALNADLRYDEFVKRQLAADQMAVEPTEIAALGFLGLSPVYHKEPKLSQPVISVIVADEWDERIDTVTRGLLGLTVACARCHDHKFDPISMDDYYALAGVMASTQLVEWPLVATSTEQAAALTEVQLQIVDHDLRLSYAKTMRDTAKGNKADTAPFEAAIADLSGKLERLKAEKLFDGPIANAVRDAGLWINGDDPAWTVLDFRPGQPRDLPIFLRGNVNTPGRIVPRRFIEVLSQGEPKSFVNGSGRLELANAIVSDAQPLAARVMVNRVWGWHFGQPLVATPGNFGALGERPTNPELLDDLAAQFVEQGWSLKWLHREIVGSAVYRQASTHNAAYHAIDPANRLLWRANRRRLEAEAWRDAALAVAGQLDTSLGGEAKSLDEDDNRRRTLYGKVSRQRPADVQRLFDFPDAKRHSDGRDLTTTPLQQLYLLNSPFLRQRAAALAERAVDQSAGDPQQVVTWLFRHALQRDPTRDETKAALRLADSEGGTPTQMNWTTVAHGVLAGNEFLYLD